MTAPRSAAVWAALAFGAAAACGGAARGTAATPAPARAPTGAAPALAHLPAGADVVIELDLARARANPVIGSLVDGWLGSLDPAGLPVDPTPPLAGAAWVVLAGYGVGTPTATTVTLLAPGPGAEVPGGTAIGDGIVVVAPPTWIDRVRAVTAPTSLAADAALLALRDHAMPAAADGAVVRLTAQLSADARIALANAIGFEPVPRRVSVWADIADDAAVIADLDARDAADPAAQRRLRTTLGRWLARLAARPEVRALGLGPPVARTQLVAPPRAAWVRAVTLVSPDRLAWVVAAARRQDPAPEGTP